MAGGSRCFAYPAAIGTLGTLELEYSEASHFGRVDKAGNFATVFLFKGTK